MNFNIRTASRYKVQMCVDRGHSLNLAFNVRMCTLEAHRWVSFLFSFQGKGRGRFAQKSITLSEEVSIILFLTHGGGPGEYILYTQGMWMDRRAFKKVSALCKNERSAAWPGKPITGWSLFSLFYRLRMDGRGKIDPEEGDLNVNRTTIEFPPLFSIHSL